LQLGFICHSESWPLSVFRFSWSNPTEIVVDGPRIRAFGVDGRPLSSPELQRRLATPTLVATFFYDIADLSWARRWPAEDLWSARLGR